jgi:drug/metabolite transporter (DMT)-like permease
VTPRNQARASPAAVAFALLIVYVVWGSTYLGIRVMVESVPPLIGTGARFLLAGGLLYAWLRFRGGRERVRASAAEVGGATVLGAAVLGAIALVAVAEQHVESGLAALLIASVPLFVTVLRVVNRENVPVATLGGVAVGLLGVALVALPEGGSGGASAWAVLLLLLGALTTALGSYYSPRLSLPADTLVSTALQMLTVGLILVLLGPATGELDDLRPSAIESDSVVAFVYLTLIGSLLAYSAFVWLLANAPVSTVSTYAYVNPVVALFLGWLVLDEQLTALIVAGATIVVASVALVVRREKEPAVKPAPGSVGAASRPPRRGSRR